jgi:acyl transferase domain-containing protein
MGKAAIDSDAIAWLPSLKKGRADSEQLAASLGELYCRGIDVQWGNVAPNAPRRRVELPTYPFQRKRLWIEPSSRKAGHRSILPGAVPGHRCPVSAFAALHVQFSPSSTQTALLQDHRA